MNSEEFFKRYYDSPEPEKQQTINMKLVNNCVYAYNTLKEFQDTIKSNNPEVLKCYYEFITKKLTDEEKDKFNKIINYSY